MSADNGGEVRPEVVPVLRGRDAKARRGLQTPEVQRAIWGNHMAPGSGCEVCSWVVPDLMPAQWGGLNIHHVVPVKYGGSDHPSNLVALCPNHHAIAHAIGRLLSGARVTRAFWGVHPRDLCVLMLKSVARDVPSLVQSVTEASARFAAGLESGELVLEETDPEFEVYGGEQVVTERIGGMLYSRRAYECDCYIQEARAAEVVERAQHFLAREPG
jgi:hypothetical protein